MSLEENKVIVRRFFEELLSAGNLAVADELLAPTYVNYFPGLPEPVRGPEAFKHLVATYRAAFPDMHVVVDDLIAEGDTVAVRFTVRGTHQGEFQGLAPTGKSVTMPGQVFYHFVDGKIAEDRPVLDQLGLMQQLGVIPAPGQAGA